MRKYFFPGCDGIGVRLAQRIRWAAEFAETERRLVPSLGQAMPSPSKAWDMLSRTAKDRLRMSHGICLKPGLARDQKSSLVP